MRALYFYTYYAACTNCLPNVGVWIHDNFALENTPIKVLASVKPWQSQPGPAGKQGRASHWLDHQDYIDAVEEQTTEGIWSKSFLDGALLSYVRRNGVFLDTPIAVNHNRYHMLANNPNTAQVNYETWVADSAAQTPSLAQALLACMLANSSVCSGCSNRIATTALYINSVTQHVMAQDEATEEAPEPELWCSGPFGTSADDDALCSCVSQFAGSYEVVVDLGSGMLQH